MTDNITFPDSAKWIKMADRLPRISDCSGYQYNNVLAISISRYSNTSWSYRCSLLYFHDKQFCTDSNGNYYQPHQLARYFDYWAPMPEPPNDLELEANNQTEASKRKLLEESKKSALNKLTVDERMALLGEYYDKF